ncbi:FMN-dependent L-lactate dehydrogenase LldD [Pantoea sp. OXWO6B1]|uniref:FMN-dependent L-lactate dehydrogenase LldD n=1 Tax=Pantoea sp. OXWO6B1 TaxID=1835724 RepID=UPI0007C74A03|nr:FMN-dependent L-lactate dehydrogenase LldD [Pantoea sp. OXWO6B1]OAD97987.1 alpha-hydroxy-acid oxidizing enzyme [Pantoea sp. OXWO6B1]
MIVSSPNDYREAASHRLPKFLFDYIDGGAITESTMKANMLELASLSLRQRVLSGVGDPTMHTEIFGSTWTIPLALGPVGASGMYTRRGEVKAACAASKMGIPYTLSTVSVCSIEEVASHASGEVWSQLYVLKDRGYMRNVLERSWASGVKTLVFTVDMPLPASRYRDNRSGMSGSRSKIKQYLQACTHPRWAFDVGLKGRPLTFGNIEAYVGNRMTMDDYMGFINKNFDPTITWHDLEWIRDAWKGNLVIKGILDPEDAKVAVRFGANGIVVSNHGGRQLDGAIPTAKALPRIVETVGDDITILVDSGVRSGLDVIRMLALGAKGVLLGRSYIYALAAAGEKGVAHLLHLYAEDIKITMTLIGAASIAGINTDCLDRLEKERTKIL